MAHLVDPDEPVRDGNWSLTILVTDMNIQRSLSVHGSTHIGGLMLDLVQEIARNDSFFSEIDTIGESKDRMHATSVQVQELLNHIETSLELSGSGAGACFMVQELLQPHPCLMYTASDVSRDWSDHALWWPEKRRWLHHTRSTLDQLTITADTKLEFTPMHKDCRVELPDHQMIDARVDFSVNVVKACGKLCSDLGIRHHEELGLKRYLNPDQMRKSADVESNNTPQPTRPGEESVGPMTLRKATPIFASQSNLDRRRQQSPALSQSGHIFNAHEMGTLPRHGTLPRGVSPSPGAYNDSMRRAILPSISFSEGLESEQFDMALVHSPRIPPNKDTPVFRPQNYVEKAALNRCWLDSSRSLMEQGVFEGDIIQLRFKFVAYYDLNSKYDPVRINQLYEQIKWSILLEEYDHTEEEATLFAALQLQATLQRDSPEPEGPLKDDVDVMLDELERNLDLSVGTRHADLTTVPELADYLKYMKPKKLAAFKGFNRAYFSFRDLYLSYYKSAQDAQGGGNPIGHFLLKGCEVSPDVSVSQGKFHIKLLVPTAEGMTDFVIKCDTEHQYARWMAAFRLASKGRSMADASYQQEVDSIKGLLHMQTGTPNGRENGSGHKSQPVRLPDDFNVDEYVSSRYVRRARSKQHLQQRISDAHSNIKQLSSTDAKLQYIRAWQALPEHSLHYFVVRFRNARKNDLIAVASNRIVKLNPDNGESVKTWRFSTMRTWHVNWEIRHIKIHFEEEEIEFKPLSADCKVVHEFIGGYIYLSLRNKESKQTFNEEEFQKLTGGWS